MSTLHLPPRPGEIKQQVSDTSTNTAKAGSETAKDNAGASSQVNLKVGQGADRIGRAFKDGQLKAATLSRDETRDGTPSNPSDS